MAKLVEWEPLSQLITSDDTEEDEDDFLPDELDSYFFFFVLHIYFIIERIVIRER